MSPWHRPVKSHILNRARPRWKNTQSIFPKIYHISPLSFFFFPGMNVYARCSDFAGMFLRHTTATPLGKTTVAHSGWSSVKWSPMDLVLAWGTSDAKWQTPPEKGFPTLQWPRKGFHRWPLWISWLPSQSPWFHEIIFYLKDPWFQQGSVWTLHMGFHWSQWSSVVNSKNWSKVQKTHEKAQILVHDEMQQPDMTNR